VGGVEMKVDDRTIGQSSLQPGDTVRFAVGRSSNGRLHALTLSHVQPDASPSGAIVSGAVQEVTNEGVRVAGQWIPITSATLLKLNIKQGDKVDVTLDNSSGGPVAGSVKPSGGESTTARNTGFFTLEGTIQGDVRSTNQWTIGGLRFVNSTSIDIDAKAGNAQDGARALVDATVQGDQLIATRVVVLAAQAPANAVFLAGSFQGLNDDGYWIIGGLPVIPPDNAKKPDNGSQLAIQGTQIAGEITASHIKVIQGPDESDIQRFQGSIQSIAGTLWSLDTGGQVRVTSTTPADGKAIGGARVLGWGTLDENGVLRPIYVRVLDASPVVATPSPIPTASN
jgi:cold shock CspA family protein